MCGIVALVQDDASGLERIDAMLAALWHRGPDDSGIELLPEDGVALGARRLSILDVAGGHQPMWDEARRHAIVFNGEIYNHRPLRSELTALGHSFASNHSDTEVLVHGFEEWGVELFPRLSGMFALAIWDRDERRLIVARDRMGEKPLFIGRLDQGYAVASELKALFAHPGIRRDINSTGLDQYLAFDFTFAPTTLVAGVEKLPSAHYAIIDAGGVRKHPYWRLEFKRRIWGEAELNARLDAALDHAVASRLESDSPVGLFLSGGLDSTTIGYYMRRHTEIVDSFSIGFENKAFDESEYAALAARHLGTRHHLEVFSEEQLLDIVPKVPEVLDEPMGDESILPSCLVSSMAGRQLKVVLGGDGSDELLMGYRMFKTLRVYSLIDRLPLPLRKSLARLAGLFPEDGGALMLGRRLLGDISLSPSGRLLRRLGSFHGDARTVLSDSMRSSLPDEIPGAPEDALATFAGASFPGAAEETIAAYLRGYLQEDILVKVDRASMAASLEVRNPFLETGLIELLCSVPASQKLGVFSGKQPLRRLMRGRIPDAIIDRPKHGFSVPLDAAFRGPLQPLVRENLSPGRLSDAGYFDPKVVTRLLEDHFEGRKNNGKRLWLLLQFELWRQHWNVPRWEVGDTRNSRAGWTKSAATAPLPE